MKTLIRRIKKILVGRRLQGQLRRVISVIACVVVFATTYALVLPAITMESLAQCGIEAHEHTAGCYEKVLVCGQEETGGHSHTDECWQTEKVLVCELEEHTHGPGCRDAEGNLTCEKTEHVHDENCYREEKTLICGMEEAEGHAHTDACYEDQLICGKEVHIHSPECYENNGPSAEEDIFAGGDVADFTEDNSMDSSFTGDGFTDDGFIDNEFTDNGFADDDFTDGDITFTDGDWEYTEAADFGGADEFTEAAEAEDGSGFLETQGLEDGTVFEDPAGSEGGPAFEDPAYAENGSYYEDQETNNGYDDTAYVEEIADGAVSGDAGEALEDENADPGASDAETPDGTDAVNPDEAGISTDSEGSTLNEDPSGQDGQEQNPDGSAGTDADKEAQSGEEAGEAGTDKTDITDTEAGTDRTVEAGAAGTQAQDGTAAETEKTEETEETKETEAAGPEGTEADAAGADAALADQTETEDKHEAEMAADGLQAPADLERFLTDRTGIWYYPAVFDEDGKADTADINSETVTDWKRVEEDTVLSPEDFVRIYIAYTLPTGTLSETNPVARYTLPAGLHLTPAQVEAINTHENGYYLSLGDGNAQTGTGAPGTEPQDYLGAEAVEGIRTPDQAPNGQEEEYISAVVKAEEIYDEDGNLLCQELVFTFLPYTVEKNGNVYADTNMNMDTAASGSPDDSEDVEASDDLIREGKAVSGFLTVDFSTGQIDFADTETDNIKTAEITFARENETEGIGLIRENLTMNSSADFRKTQETGTVQEGEENSGSDKKEAETPDDKTAGGKDTTSDDKDADKEKEKDLDEDPGEDTDKNAERKKDADHPADLPADAMPARTFEDSITLETARPASVGESGTVAEAAGALPARSEVKVRVEADEGTFPAGTTMVLSAVDSKDMDAVAEAVENAVANNTDTDGKKNSENTKTSKTCGFQAVDISFRDADGNEIEPAKPVRVVMTSSLIKEAAQNNAISAPVVVHVDNEGKGEQIDLIDPEKIEAAKGRTEEDLIREAEAAREAEEELNKEEEDARKTEENAGPEGETVEEDNSETTEEKSDAAGDESETTEDELETTEDTPVATTEEAEMQENAETDRNNMDTEAVTDTEYDDANKATSEDSVGYETDRFSVYAIVYTVDFHWEVNGKMYEFSIPGGGFVSLEHVVEVLGIARIGENTDNSGDNEEIEGKNAPENDAYNMGEETGIEDNDANKGTYEESISLNSIEVGEAAKKFVADVARVEFSSPELVDVSKVERETTVGQIKENCGLECQYSAGLTEEQIAQINAQVVSAGDWSLISMQPFETEETLTITMQNGEQWTVKVTDAQQIQKVITTSGETLQVTVEVFNESDVACFEDLRVNELAADSEAYAEAYEAVVSTKAAWDESFDNKHCGLFAADIELLDKEGKVFEPEGTVTVKMEWLYSPADESVSASTMEIQHLVRQDGKIHVQTVASGTQIVKEEEGITAQFSVDSFSTFTLTWTDNGSSTVISDQASSTMLNIQNNSGETYATVTVHFVDTNGNNIQSPIGSQVNGTTPITINGLLNSEIEGYEYQGAYYGSHDGQSIQEIAVARQQGTTTGDVFVYLGTTSNSYGGGQLNGSSSAPTGYTEFYADAQGLTQIYFRNGRFRTTNNIYGTVYANGPVYGKTTGSITNYQYVLSFDNLEITPLEHENTTGMWNDAADIYLVYENLDPDKCHATIHYGTLNNDGSFTELQDSIMLDTNAASISLNATIAGYECVGAYYSTDETDMPAADTQQIASYLRNVDDVWQYTNVETSEKDSLADGSHIYVSYKEKTTHGTPTPDNAELPPPTTVKKVTSNLDGTYDIQLDIIGQQIEKTNRKGANVLLIFDRTSSMSGSMANSPDGQRIGAAKQAVHTLVDALNPSVNPVEIAVYSFDRFVNAPYSSGGSYWTTDGQAITDYTDALTLAASGSAGGKNGGTNWEAALDQAAEVLTTADNDPTYVIFLTDGNPTIHQGNCNNNGGINSNPTATSDVYTRAQTAAGNLDPKYKIYGVLCANQSDGPLLQTLVNYLNNNGHDATHILANDGATLTKTFNNIADYIVSQLGTADVSTNDGITSLSSVSASVSGAAGAFQYYKAYEVIYKNNKYIYVDENMTEHEITDPSEVNEYHYQDSQGHPKTYLYYNRAVWNDAPGASYNNATGVTWDLASEGILKEGQIYSIRFTIWPSQEAYDLLADLNNGIKVYEAGHDNSITDEERAQVYESGGVYYMKTNTNLDTSYTVGGNAFTDSIDYYQGAMDLDSRTISLEKLWPENFLDEYVAGQSVNGIQNEVTLTLTKDGENYLDVTVDRAHEWRKEDIYISCGLLTVHDGVVEIKEPGHDYTVTEPESFSYYWDLVSDVYRPMVIGYDGENGTVHEAFLLILDESLTEADNVNSFEIEGKIYRKQDEGNEDLNARNYRRSNLNLRKQVNGLNAPKDAYFEYTVKINDVTGEDVWFSAMEGDVYQVLEISSNVVPEYRTVAGAVYNSTDHTYTYTYNGKEYTLFAADDGTGGKMYTGFYSVPSDEEFTIKIKDGWNVRFINLLHGSTFSITEGTMDEGFSFERIDTETLHPFSVVDPDTEWNSITGQTITGTIVEPNNSFTVTYTNKWDSIGFLLEKVKEDRQTPISGSVFELEVKEDSGIWAKLLSDIEPGGTRIVIDEETGEETTVDIENPAEIGGLGIGYYRFAETVAPNGYVIMTKYTYFEVYKEGSVMRVRLTDEQGSPLTDEEDHAVTETDFAKLTDETVDSTTIFKMTITNIPGVALPSTGGPGTRIFTILGGILILGAGMLLWKRRRKI